MNSNKEKHDLTDNRQRIMMVDDDEVTLDVTQAFLKEKYIVETARTVTEALKMIREHVYPVILLDINLGKGVTGFTILDELKKMPGYKGIPVIAVTAYAMVGDREVFLEAGCTDYISKPFTRSALKALVDHALSR
ncbi:MAG: hypothetical protein HBSAPP04_16240 [Ignavibacteriaceae bacterium]|nr:MAG: response regulator [Chlorobiota bacterium]GJQ32785.1 MAG: hypothetical protein HBSAPP04_16240 [Ignavibacteriaceae bacterium]